MAADLIGSLELQTAETKPVAPAGTDLVVGGLSLQEEYPSRRRNTRAKSGATALATRPAERDSIRVQTLERTSSELGRTGLVGADLDGTELHHLLEGLSDWHQWTLARRAAKRTLDVVVSLSMLLLLVPVLAVAAVAIKVDSPGPVFYRQRRCGKDNVCFRIFKFRSMRTDADQLLAELQSQNESDGLLFKMKHDPRITRVGAFIRRYSIDELPQLINVLKGDMSLVGPRPLPIAPEDFDVLDGCRHAVRPGLTCHWQVSGRSELSYKQMVALDLAYIRESSIWTDLRLLLRTVPVVLTGSGAY